MLRIHPKTYLPASIFVLTFVLSGFLCLYLFGSASGLVRGLDVLFDSAGYRNLGNSFYGEEPIPASRLAQRGYLYALIAIGIDSMSPLLLVVFQMLAVSGAVMILVLLERNLTGQALVTPLAIFNVSLLVSPTFLMTEAFALLLGAGAMAVCATQNRYHWSLVLFFAAALIKPAFYPIAWLALILMLPTGKRIFGPLILVLLLMAPQIILTAKYGGSVQLSSAGRDNFQERFYPAVAGIQRDGQIMYYKDDKVDALMELRPEFRQRLLFALTHPGATLQTWSELLVKEHLLQGSGYAHRDNTAALQDRRNVLADLSRWANLLFVALLVPSVVGTVRFLLQSNGARRLVPLTGASILASAPLVYWQGDRVVFVGLILLLPFAGFGLTWVWGLRRRSELDPPNYSN